MNLENRNALITGGSQGLGKTIAEQFVREGANVVICARDEKLLSAARADLQKVAGRAQKVLAKPCDVSAQDQVEELAAFALKELGSVQVLVNNAGIYGPMGPTETIDLKERTRSIEINLYGVLLPTRALIPHFQKNGSGKLIILS